MKNIVKLLWPVIIGNFYMVSVFAATFYVSAEGDDRNTGMSWSSAWRTLEKAGRTASAGDEVIIRRGREPFHYLPVSHSGTENQPIIFRGESQTRRPVVTGALQEFGWQKSDITGVWEVATSANPIIVVEDRHPIERATTRTAADGQWYWGNNRLSYRPTSGNPAEHKVWRASTGGGIQIGNNSWIRIENFDCWIGQGACVGIDKGEHNIVRNIHSQFYARGVQVRGGQNNLIEDCIVQYNREGVYLLQGASHNTVRRCTAVSNGSAPVWKNGDRSGIAIGETGINVRNQLFDNEVAYNGGPDSDPGLIAYSAPETLIEGNLVHDNYAGGIVVGVFSDNSIVRNNRVIGNGRGVVLAGENNVSGLSVRRSRGVTVERNEILNNYVSMSDPDRYNDRTGGGLDLKGNKEDNMKYCRFENNIVCGTKNGPDTYISSVPDTTGSIIERSETEYCRREGATGRD